VSEITLALADRVAAPLDVLRRRVLVILLSARPVARVIASRDLRILVSASVGMTMVLGLTLGAPGLLFALGPIAFGVLHVAGDVRYLVLRRGLSRWVTAAVLAGCAALFVAALLELGLPGSVSTQAEVAIGWGWPLAMAAAGAYVARSWSRFFLIAPVLMFLLSEAIAAPYAAKGLFAYAHNLVAIGVWAVLYRRRPGTAIAVVALAAAYAAILASGVLFPGAGLSLPFGERLVDEALMILPRSIPQRTAVSIALSYVFLQGAHYAVWLLWVPQEDLPSEGTTTFRMSLRSALRDFGRPGLLLVALAAIAVVAAAFLDLHRTRGVYLSLATFHGYLEVAMLSYFVAAGRSPKHERDARASLPRSLAAATPDAP
jgi:hypothetical protein